MRSYYFISNKICSDMFYKELSRDHCYYTYINLKLPTLYGRCCYREYLKWEDTVECMFDGNSYSERDKVKFAARTFDDDAYDWWDDLKTSRCFYGERPIDTWYNMKVAMRKQFRQNGYYVRQDNDTVVGSQAKEQCCPKLARLNKELANLQDQAANIISLLSKLEELSPPPDEVSSINVKTPEKEEPLTLEHVETHKVEESLEPEQVETPTVDETLTEHAAISKVEESMSEIMEIRKEEGVKSKDFDEEIFIGEDDVSSQIEVVSFSLFNYVTSNLFVISKFIQSYGVCLREENKLLKAKKESEGGKKRKIELMRSKKRKKKETQSE